MRSCSLCNGSASAVYAREGEVESVGMKLIGVLAVRANARRCILRGALFCLVETLLFSVHFCLRWEGLTASECCTVLASFAL